MSYVVIFWHTSHINMDSFRTWSTYSMSFQIFCLNINHSFIILNSSLSRIGKSPNLSLSQPVSWAASLCSVDIFINLLDSGIRLIVITFRVEKEGNNRFYSITFVKGFRPMNHFFHIHSFKPNASIFFQSRSVWWASWHIGPREQGRGRRKKQWRK